MNSLVLLVLAAASSTPSSSSPVQATITHNCQRPTSLRVELRNGSAVPVSIDEGRLPWSQPTAMLRFSAVSAGDGRSNRLDPESRISDHFRSITIAPGKSLAGYVELDEVFPDLANRRKTSDVLIRIEFVRGPKGLRGKEGFLLAPRVRMFSQPCPTFFYMDFGR